MTKTRLMAFLVLSVTLICGCMGGGGSGGTPVFEKDVAGITATLNRFAESLRTSDPASSGLFAQTTGTSETTKILYVKDFGADLNNPNDNQTWEFRVNPADITQPAPDTAIVKASKVMSSGTTLWLIFSMVKEEGQWKIQGITIQETGVTSIVSASYYPIVPGNSMTYRSTYSGGEGAYLSTETFSSTDTYVNSGVTYYRLVYSSYGAAKRFAVAKRLAAQVGDVGSYQGTTPQGEIWGYDPYINGGVPYRILKASYALGESDVIVEKYSDTEVYTTKITFGTQFKQLTTPLKTYSVLPVLEETAYTSEGYVGSHTAMLYFAEGVGLVGSEYFGHGTTTTPQSVELLYERVVNGVVERNNPVVSAVSLTQNVIKGQGIVPVQFSVTGGTAPMTWSLIGQPVGITLSPSGYLSGTPDQTAALGAYNLTVGVVDTYSRSSSVNYVLNLTNAPTISITPANGSQVVYVGQKIAPVTFAQSGANGTVTWSVTGQPSGISISSNGVLSGTLGSGVVQGQFNLNVSAVDSIGAQGSVVYVITVLSAPGAYYMPYYTPVVPGDEYTYVPVSNGIASPSRVTTGIYQDSKVLNGLTFFKESSTTTNPAVNMRASFNPLLRGALKGQTSPQSEPFYRAVDADGNIWSHQVYTNGGTPFRIFKGWYNPGDTDVYVTSYNDGVNTPYTATTTITVGSSLMNNFFTPYGTFSNVLMLTFITEIDFGGGFTVRSKSEQYYARDVGMIGYYSYPPTSQTTFAATPNYQELLLSAKLGNTLYTNLPQITTAQNLGTATIGTFISAISLTVSGGVAPYTFLLKSGSALPDGLTLSSGGVINGTPTSQTTGDKSFTITATDAYHQVVEKIFTMTVN